MTPCVERYIYIYIYILQNCSSVVCLFGFEYSVSMAEIPWNLPRIYIIMRVVNRVDTLVRGIDLT
jgi:hypothetical protein